MDAINKTFNSLLLLLDYTGEYKIVTELYTFNSLLLLHVINPEEFVDVFGFTFNSLLLLRVEVNRLAKRITVLSILYCYYECVVVVACNAEANSIVFQFFIVITNIALILFSFFSVIFQFFIVITIRGNRHV